MRVVSLLPSAAEVVCIVASPEVIVGRSHEDDYPSAITQAPILTKANTTFTTSADVNKQVDDALAQGNALYDVNVEELKRLAPDVIVTQDLCEVCSVDLMTVQRIVKTMSPAPIVVTLDPQCLADVLQDVVNVGKALGMMSEAEVARQGLQDRIDRARKIADEGLAARGGRRPNVAILEWVDPIFPGGHWTPEIVHYSGAEHTVNRAKDPASGAGPSFAITDQTFLDSDPEIVIICPCGLDMEATLKELDIVKEKREFNGESWWEIVLRKAQKVLVVDGNQMFNRPGPRLVDALEWLTGLINDRPDIIPPNFPWKQLK
ncbi:hypothetical protein BZG36_01260 [Bifiguratus adelaidae]|uniref:Fe/B12 periplasmic-binding domain-containing protein n=1 Tax=Bifiguratus adelaidae TaxID=1938954 RepID=A0A261Y5R3_9FUNG|nr:hypothetical protein BZG36_01260 [Bifiguratus adelaidae]